MGGAYSPIVRLPIVLHFCITLKRNNESQIAYVVLFTLYSIYINVSPINLNRMKFRNEQTQHIHDAYKTVGLWSCRIIELSDYRAFGL